MGRLRYNQGESRHVQQVANRRMGIGGFGPALRRIALQLLSTAVLVLVSSCAFNEPLSEDLGIHQVWVSEVFVPDNISAADTLVAILIGSTEVGDCLTFSHADVDRDSAQARISMWAHVRDWLGPGPPPPCRTVDYRFEGSPPFVPGWFLMVINQPDSSVRVDSIRVLP
jgi:hypothetical protein